MRKFALLTTVCALAAIPLVAQAAGSSSQNKDLADFKVRVKDNDHSSATHRGDRTFGLKNMEGKIHVNGDVIYYVTPEGNEYFAPDGPYTTTSGMTFYSADGVVQYVLGPDQIVSVDADYRDTNHNGIADDINVDVETHTAN